MASKKANYTDVSLPFAALQLLAPPVRLVSAALWKVLKQRDVMQYGVVEEFVTSACENVPGLLTLRHQGKLALGLRARMVLELCRTQPDATVISPHLERIRAPAAPAGSSVRQDKKILRTVESFHSLVDALLTDPAERGRFYREQFPAEYGPPFDQELEKLLWEFLIRLDQLLPVPNLAQTVSWLSGAPPVLEACAQAATQPQILRILLRHEGLLGHLESAVSLPPSMGDSILASLSLPLSGKAPSSPPANGAKPGNGAQSANGAGGPRDTSGERPAPEERFTLIRQPPGEEAGKEGRMPPLEDRAPLENQAPLDSRAPPLDGRAPSEGAVSGRTGGRKRRRAAGSESEFDQEDDTPQEDGGARFDGARLDNGARFGGARLDDGNRFGGARFDGARNPSLDAMVRSCLRNQPRVVLERLPAASGGGAKGRGRSYRRRPPAPGRVDKENRPGSLSGSPQQQTGSGDEYVADSEDEATKNFKGRLFVKRYYRTKHGTYVPTLREFWRPGAARRGLLPPPSKGR